MIICDRCRELPIIAKCDSCGLGAVWVNPDNPNPRCIRDLRTSKERAAKAPPKPCPGRIVMLPPEAIAVTNTLDKQV